MDSWIRSNSLPSRREISAGMTGRAPAFDRVLKNRVVQRPLEFADPGQGRFVEPFVAGRRGVEDFAAADRVDGRERPDDVPVLVKGGRRGFEDELGQHRPAGGELFLFQEDDPGDDFVRPDVEANPVARLEFLGGIGEKLEAGVDPGRRAG